MHPLAVYSAYLHGAYTFACVEFRFARAREALEKEVRDADSYIFFAGKNQLQVFGRSVDV
jgi:hypothetical protein